MTEKLNLFQNVTPLNRRFTFLGGTGTLELSFHNYVSTYVISLHTSKRRKMDLISELCTMAFASRLKRLGDLLKADATRIYQANGIDFHDSWFLVAVALSRQDRISVTDMAVTLGISHAAISQMASAMERKGYIASEPDKKDRRKTLLYLTNEGRSTIEMIQPFWDAISLCTDELIDSTGKDLLLAITNIEEQLKERSLLDRVSNKMQHRNR